MMRASIWVTIGATSGPRTDVTNTPHPSFQEKEQEKTDLGAFNAHTGKKCKLLTGAVERNAITEHGGNKNPMETVYDLTTCARQMRNYRQSIAPRQRTQGQRDNGPA